MATPRIVDFMAAANSLKRQRNLRACNPIAKEVSFELPEGFDVIVRLSDDEESSPPFYQCLAPKMTLLSFMEQTFSFTLETPGAHQSDFVVHTILYRDLIAAASAAFCAGRDEPWMIYARDIFYTAYGLLLGSPNAERPYGTLEEPPGSGIVITREWLPGHLISAVRFFDYPMQCAAFWLRHLQAENPSVHPLAVIVGEEYQKALEIFEEESRFLPMAHVYLHDAGHAKTAPDADTWFPQW